MTVARTNQFKILLSDDEKTWLQALAEKRGLTPTDYVRLFIRDQIGIAVDASGRVTPRPKKKC